MQGETTFSHTASRLTLDLPDPVFLVLTAEAIVIGRRSAGVFSVASTGVLLLQRSVEEMAEDDTSRLAAAHLRGSMPKQVRARDDAISALRGRFAPAVGPDSREHAGSAGKVTGIDVLRAGMSQGSPLGPGPAVGSNLGLCEAMAKLWSG